MDYKTETKKALHWIGEIYIDWYKWLPILLGIVTFLLLFSCRTLSFKDLTVYFQTIFLGLVAFGIPFMWNAYQRILEVKSESIGDKIEHLLSREYWQKANTYFESILLFPTAFLVFVGLIISPYLPLFWAASLTAVAVVFFIYQPRIFDWIENICSTNLRKYLENKKPLDDNLAKAFNEIWRKNDDSIEKELGLIPSQLLDLFSKKIDELLS